ncbi:MAG: GNAT family N-acetyltransferase, partial [Methylocystis sp.]|nr:GNAT family N-acetyltransferase [Methylocystis sp.]
MQGDQKLTARFADSLSTIEAAAWDACANPPGASFNGERYNPFVSHAFLSALERSKSVGARTGWTPAYTLVEDEKKRLVACAPSYVKTHSFGEYVFDQGWADAYERAGGRYYPKIQAAVPFTP